MAREKFEDRKLTGDINVACKYEDGTVRYWKTTKEQVIKHIVHIVNEYAKENYTLTLRQLHYQLVTQNWIVNHDSAYKKLGDILDDCRYSGIIDWDAIEDRGRVPYLRYWVEGISDALQDTVDQYRIDRQRGQENVVELWTEKDALSGILKRTTDKYHIRLVVNKGYTSSSAIYNAYERIVKAIKEKRRSTILYFGDHDPSGLDMVRDITERLTFFLCRGRHIRNNDPYWQWVEDDNVTVQAVSEETDNYKFKKLLSSDVSNDKLQEDFDAARVKMYLDAKKLFTVIPIGLTMEQINKYKLPPNPTKLTDSRADKYIRKFGKICWEVDALKPQVLTQIVEKNVRQQIDVDLYDVNVEAEENDILNMRKLFKKYLK